MRILGDERAVSDVLAFMIVFSIIITSVALVYGTGFSSLDQVRSGEQKVNAERAFEAVALSMEDVVQGSAPRRGGSLNLGGALLQVEESSPTVTVEVDDSEVFNNSTGSFVYTLDNTEVAYENGGVFRSDRGNSVAVQRSGMTCSNGRAIVSLVLLRSDSNPIDSQGGIEFTLEERRTELVYSDVDGAATNNVTVNITDSDYENGWRSTMEAQGWEKTGSESYSCNPEPDHVVVRVTVIDVTFRSP